MYYQPGYPGYGQPDEYGRQPGRQPGQPDEPGYGQPGQQGFYSQGQPGYGQPDEFGRVPNQPGYGQFGPSPDEPGKYRKEGFIYFVVFYLNDKSNVSKLYCGVL